MGKILRMFENILEKMVWRISQLNPLFDKIGTWPLISNYWGYILIDNFKMDLTKCDALTMWIYILIIASIFIPNKPMQ